MSGFDELKKFAVSDILSVNGKEKLSYTIDKHLNSAYEFGCISSKIEQQKKIDALQDYINKAQSCLPYYLLDIKSNENWIGGVQTEIAMLEEKMEAIFEYLNQSSSPLDLSIDEIEEILK